MGFGEAGALDVATVLGEAAAAWGPPDTEADCAPHTPRYTICPLRKDTRRLGLGAPSLRVHGLTWLTCSM